MSYKKKLQQAISYREQIKQAIPDLKYKRVYTRKLSNGECQTMFWGLSRDSRNKISKFVVGDDFKHEPYAVTFKMPHSIWTKAGIRNVGKLSFKLSTNTLTAKEKKWLGV
jgi:hypothetical protein